jgi:two-component system, cell cycle sensor histidine kinase and response regulator CckA
MPRATDRQDGTILVVDDAESIRKLVCAMLRQDGYRCVEACDGLEALELLQHATESVSLVLTDMIMPNMNGAELAKEVSRMLPEVRIIFMSGYSDDPVVQQVEQTVSYHFLPKPFTSTALIEKVRQSLELPWAGLPESKPRTSGPI